MCHYYSTYKCHTFRYSLKVLKGVINKKRKEKLLFAPLERCTKKKKDFCYHEKETERFLQRFITKLPAVVGGACVKQHVIAKNTLKLYWDHVTVG